VREISGQIAARAILSVDFEFPGRVPTFDPSGFQSYLEIWTVRPHTDVTVCEK